MLRGDMTGEANSDSWIRTAQRIQAIAQTGLTYAVSPYDVERYSELAGIAASMMAGPEPERIDSAETTGAEFFAEDEIPPLSLTRTLPEQIRFVFQSRREPAAPVAFD